MQQLDLALQVRRAGGRLIGFGITVPGRPALENIRDIDILTSEIDRGQHGVEQLSGPADEGFAAPVFLCPRGFTDDEQIGRPAADAEYRAGAPAVQGALRAAAHGLLQSAPIGSVLCRGNRSGFRFAAQHPDGDAHRLKILFPGPHRLPIYCCDRSNAA